MILKSEISRKTTSRTCGRSYRDGRNGGKGKTGQELLKNLSPGGGNQKSPAWWELIQRLESSVRSILTPCIQGNGPLPISSNERVMVIQGLSERYFVVRGSYNDGFSNMTCRNSGPGPLQDRQSRLQSYLDLELKARSDNTY
jgi:hypothetical protein